MTREKHHKTIVDRLKEWKEFATIITALGTGLYFFLTKGVPMMYALMTLSGDTKQMKSDLSEIRMSVDTVKAVMKDSMMSRGKLLYQHESDISKLKHRMHEQERSQDMGVFTPWGSKMNFTKKENR